MTDTARTDTQTLSDIAARLERIEQQLQTPTLPPSTPQKETPARQNKPVNRTVLAGTFALIGFKGIGFIGAKLGLAVDAIRAYATGGKEAVGELFQLLFGVGKNQSLNEIGQRVKWTLLVGGVSSVVGLIGGAVLGWSRGDRIDNPGDLLAHPIESMKKIFAKDTVTGTASPMPKAGAANLHALRYDGRVETAGKQKAL